MRAVRLFSALLASAPFLGWGAAVAQTPAQTVAARWEFTVATDFRYFSWEGTRGFPTRATGSPGSGSQFYVPYAAQLVGKLPNDFKLEVLGRGGWVWARQSTAGLSGEVATTTDTVGSATLTYLGFNGIQPFAAVSVNLPTGRSSLPGLSANARMDPDLVEISSYGEGFNIGPTLGINLPITPALVATASAGYTWRDPYNRENTLNATDPFTPTAVRVNPGEVTTATASLAYQSGPWAASISGSVSWESETTQNFRLLYRPGVRYLGTAILSYDWSGFGVTTLTASAAHSNRNQVLFLGAPDLIAEIFNTNSNVYRVGAQHLFPVRQLWIGPAGSLVYRDQNGYDATTLQFVPEKERWGAGAVAKYSLTDTIVLNARVEHVWVHENERLAPNGGNFSVLANAFIPGSVVPNVSSTGWQAAGGFNAKF